MSNKMNNKTNKIKYIFISSGTQKVLDYLVNQNNWKIAKEIQRNISLSKAGVNLSLNKLLKLGLIKKEQKGKTYLYRVNSSSIIKQFKVLENVIGCFSLTEKLKLVSQKIILFGSASRGENLPNSDIDLFVVTHNPEEVKKIIEKDKLKDKLQPIIRSPLEYTNLEKKDPVFYQEIERGIILWEKEEHYADEI